MKKLALITLIMILGLGGCAISPNNPVKQDWDKYWAIESKGWGEAKQAWADYLKNETRGWGTLR